MKRVYKIIIKAVANVFAILFGVILVGGNILMSPDVAGPINDMLGIRTQEKVNSSEGKDTQYYKSEFESIAQLKESAHKVVADITAEGAVLLKNDGDALPLAAGKKVNLYSINSVNYIFQGGGSSYAKRADTVSLKDGLEMAGLDVNDDLWNWYTQNANNANYAADHNSNTSSDAASYSINDVPWAEIGSAKNAEAEAGIFVLSRYGTEATDPYMSGGSTSDATNGNYLELSPREKTVLKGMKALKAEGKLNKIIVLLNSANQVQCDYIDNEEYGIDAVLWVGEGGASGTVGIGRILTGESPSGRLTDTYWNKHYYNPVYANFGDYENGGVDLGFGRKSNKYIVYQEGIYNGYRYTETRYEDVVTGNPNAGDFVYEDVVSYPFGYGLSYASFGYSDFNVFYDDKIDVYNVNVTVTNNDATSGKEVVQIYLQQPYTAYDREHNIEKSAVELVGYAKTKELGQGESETLNMAVEGKWLASYDAYGAGTYIVDEGNYYFTAAKNANDATNNILAAKARSTANGGEGLAINASSMTGEGNTDLVKKFTKSFDDKTYSVSDVTENSIQNRFDDVDLNRYDGAGSNRVTYISRKNWSETVKLGLTSTHGLLNNHVVVTATQQMAEDAKKGSAVIEKDETEYPKYGDGTTYSMTLGALLSVLDGELQHVEYGDSRWEELLNQLTWDDTVMLLSNGLRKTYGLTIKPQTIDGNGALGPVGATSSGDDAYRYSSNAAVAELRYAFLYDDPDKDSSPVMYPCAAIIASTFNDALVEELGKAIGEDCLWAGYSGLYGPGVNIHRGAYNGRAFEYYSEDALLSGYICAAQVKGIQSKGVYTYLKHAILNEQEHNREGVNTWANEQTVRQNYLRAFEIAIVEGGAYNVMTGFNRMGVKWTSAHGFINTVLRGEFGMRGFAVSDYWQNNYMDMVGGILGGCALPDGDLSLRGASSSALYKYSSGYGKLAWAMREEVHRILYVVVNSNAMNGNDESTYYVSIMPEWITTLSTLQIVISVLFGLGVAAYIAVNVLDQLPRGKKRTLKAAGEQNEE